MYTEEELRLTEKVLARHSLMQEVFWDEERKEFLGKSRFYHYGQGDFLPGSDGHKIFAQLNAGRQELDESFED